MSLRLDYKSHGEYLQVYVTGSYVFNDALSMLPEKFMKCRNLNISSALIDFTEMKGEPMATQKALFGIAIEREYIKHLDLGGEALKVALVGSSVTSFEPALNIVTATNLTFNLLSNREDALKWLGV